MAKVRLNGVEIGGVWTFPYELDITGVVKNVQNKIEVDVVNCWQVAFGDARLRGERKTWLAQTTIFKEDRGRNSPDFWGR